jgi:parallel beta-helix repeat protein
VRNVSGVRRLTGGIWILGVVVLAATLTPPAYASSGTRFITSDTTLTEDHDGNIVIAADGVTVDCGGHLVDPSDPTMWGAVLVNGFADVTIRNCRVTNALNGIAVDGSSARTLVTGNEAFGNAAAGIAVANSVDTRIVGNNATGNLDNGIGFFQVTGVHVVGNVTSGNLGTAGIAMFRADGGVFRGNMATESSHKGFNIGESNDNLFSGNISSNNAENGFDLFESSGNRFEANASNNNGWNGFYEQRSPETTWNDNEAAGNGDSGFVLVEQSDDATLVGNVATDNAGRGFALDGVSGSLIVDNVARENGADGVMLRSGSENLFQGNRSSGNGTYGFVLNGESAATTRNTVAWNRASENGFEGIALVFGASDNEVVGNISQGSDFEGISLFFGSDHNVIRANVLTGNASSGVLVVQSSHNSITDNRAMRNNTRGHENQGGISLLEGASFNEVVQNVACGNENADGYSDGSGSDNVWQANVLCTTIGI